LPGVILLHGSEGFDETYLNYAQSLAENGISSLIINRFFGNFFEEKPIFDTPCNQLSISLEQEMVSTYAAVKLLRSHPKVDKNEIGFIGWSRRGNVALECRS